MIDFSYLYKGLCGLANAHRAGPMAGHLGAAVVAGYFFGEDQPELDDGVYTGMSRELDRILGGEESIWFDAKKAGITIAELFQPVPREQPKPELIASIPDALSGNIDQTRQSGHNVIFAAIAVRALQNHPDYATPTIVTGIRKLIGQFNGAIAGRGYYGKERGWLTGDKVSLPADSASQPYEDLASMANVVCDELVQSAAIHRQGFGGLWHVINHSAGLVELSLRGHKELARRGLAAHYHHLRLYRSLPALEEELGPMTRADHDPRTTKYWTTGTLKRDQARLTHRIKTLYGFFVLSRIVDDESKRQQAEQSLLYLMA